jgi:hypothetical protein
MSMEYIGPQGKLTIRGFTFRPSEIPPERLPRFIARFPELKEFYKSETTKKSEVEKPPKDK